ncbi:MAG: hypothetical protein A2905_06095 [Candidatus Levybacteria bacterium RIFCSPLOWO2_01_FULL_36_10]|nr:MAG: hypothetical protein A2905_06095 [Candidatus Levybacteria bacterium RIFCSPLOWO2_01_FULL_36_10]
MYWFVYIARCNDNTLYTGITTDLIRRESEHNTNNRLGAKSLRSKRPIRIVYYEKHGSQAEARSREIEIKGWKRRYKLQLVLGFNQKSLKKIF